MLICAALSANPCELICNNICGDVLKTIDCLNALGADIKCDGDTVSVNPIKTPRSGAVLDCGESGATLRFMLPLCCALGAECEFIMGERLAKRPVKPLTDELSRHGIRIDSTAGGLKISGRLNANELNVPADISSQYVSGCLLALSAMGGGSVNITSKINSAPYIDMTVSVLRECGVELWKSDGKILVRGRPNVKGRVMCEGDWSGAAFWLCAAAIGKMPISVSGLDINSAQGDKRILDILRGFGALVDIKQDIITVSPAPLSAAIIDASDIPDLVPILSVICACANGVSTIRGTARLRTKESDRVVSVCDMLSSLGGSVKASDDEIEIYGTGLSGGSVNTFGDHRIIMSTAAASNACSKPIVLDRCEGYDKSYVGFLHDLSALGGKYECIQG